MIPFWFLKRVTEETNKGTSKESNALKYFKADIIRFLKLHHVEKYDVSLLTFFKIFSLIIKSTPLYLT